MARPVHGARRFRVVLTVPATGERRLSRHRALDAHVHSQQRAFWQVLLRPQHPRILQRHLARPSGAGTTAVGGGGQGWVHAVAGDAMPGWINGVRYSQVFGKESVDGQVGGLLGAYNPKGELLWTLK